MKASIRPSWTVESAPSVINQATSKGGRGTGASRFCARMGDGLESMKCCSPGITAAGVTIGAPLRGGWNARHEAHSASPLLSQAASVRRHFCPLGRLTTSKEASRLLKGLDWQRYLGRAL